jgi:uncharacterized membrane protein HdeD (DUF308 family)
MKGAAALTLVVAIVLAAQGIGLMGCGLKMKPQGGWMVLALAGFVSLLIGIALVLRFPFNVVDQPGAMAGIALALAGTAHIMMAMARRNIRQDPAG